MWFILNIAADSFHFTCSSPTHLGPSTSSGRDSFTSHRPYAAASLSSPKGVSSRLLSTTEDSPLKPLEIDEKLKLQVAPKSKKKKKKTRTTATSSSSAVSTNGKESPLLFEASASSSSANKVDHTAELL